MSNEKIASLVSHPGWQELARKYRDEFEKEAQAIGRRVLLTGSPVLSETDLERRAYWRALFKIMEAPGNAVEHTIEALEVQ